MIEHHGDVISVISQATKNACAAQVLSDVSSHNSQNSVVCSVRVPGHLETDGLLRHQYVNQQYPWDGHEQLVPPEIPQKNHIGVYARDFDFTSRCSQVFQKSRGNNSERITLTFDGAATAIYVWLNGVFHWL